MKADKLLALADLLVKKNEEWSKLPEGVLGHFNMCFWKMRVKESCGFAGCAIGTLIEFAPETTRLKFHEGSGDIYRYVSGICDWGFEAIVEEFDIDLAEAKYLFDAYQYEHPSKTDPIVVANRIKDFVKGKRTDHVS